MIPVKEVKLIWERDLSKLVSETYARPFRLQQLNMLPNGFAYEIELYEVHPSEDFYHEFWWQEALEKFAKWQQLTKPADMDDFGWQLYMEREAVDFDTNVIWSDLVSRNLLEPGNYYLHVWW